MISLLIAGCVSLFFALIATPYFIRWVSRHGIGQQIREDGPQGHLRKAGTPTMGGLCIIAGGVAGYVVPHFRNGTVFTRQGLLVVSAFILAGFIGFLDDFIKIRHQRSLGLTSGAKMIGLLAVAGAFAYLAVHWAHVATPLAFTRSDNFHISLGSWGWGALAVVAIVATANAVNITDGLDGLAAGSGAFSFAALMFIAFWQFRHPDIYRTTNGVRTLVQNSNQGLDLAVLCIALATACVGFLWWNAAPARIFMGDTGSLAMGTAMAALAMVMQVHLLLIVIGGLFVIETLSVIIQVATFRIFHRRVFRMAPLHHHFELRNWPETTVIIRFWILAALFMTLALGLFYADYLAKVPPRRELIPHSSTKTGHSGKS